MRGIGAAVLIAAAVAATQGQAAQSASQSAAAEEGRLLRLLQKAGDESSAAFLEQRVRTLWVRRESPAARLLQTRGQRDLKGLAVGNAIEDFSAALTLDPSAGELYVGRATARSMTGAYLPALDDIAAAVSREPRNFDALAALSRIAEAHGDFAGALSAWQRLLAIDPHTPGGEDRLEALRRKAEGMPT